MKSRSMTLTTLVIAVLLPLLSGAQELPLSMTGAALDAEVQSVITSLNNLGANFSGDAMIVTNNASAQLSSALEQLRSILHGEVNVPLSTLSSDVQNSARLLYAATENLKLLLDRQRNCLFAQLDLFLSGVETNVANLKSGIPFVKGGRPRLASFQFNGRNTRNVVPRTGGRVTFFGYDLWESAPPKVSILNNKRDKSLLEPEVQKGASKDEVSLLFPENLIHDHMGECLQVKIETFSQKHVLFIPAGQERTAELYYPLCIPGEFATKFKIEAWVQYDVPQPQRYALDPWQNFRFDNASCNNRGAVSMTKGWSLPPGFSIVDIETRKSEVRNDDNNINFTYAGSTITAAGTQASPTCVTVKIPPFGPTIEKLLHTAIWSYDARPVIAGTSYQQRVDSASVENVEMQMPQTRTCLEVEKVASDAGRSSTMWFNVTPVIRGQEAPKAFRSPRITTVNAASTGPAQFGSYVVSATFNPVPVNGKSQVCTAIDSPALCGY